MIGIFRLIERTFDYGPRWWRWTFRDPARLVVVAFVAIGFAAVPGYNSGASWAAVPSFVGGVGIFVVLLAPGWFWAGSTVQSRRFMSDLPFREAFNYYATFGTPALAEKVMAQHYGKPWPLPDPWADER